jgi:hypothetical protein
MRRVILFAILVVTMTVTTGCTISPADRAFVEATRKYYDATYPIVIAAITTGASPQDSEAVKQHRKNQVAEQSDFGALVSANEGRVENK